MRDSELLKRPEYTKLSDIYRKYFSLGSLGESINLKFALISLLGYIVNSMKKKKPGTTYYEVTAKLAEKTGLDEDTIQAIAIITEDFSYGCTDFPTFGVQPKDMPTKIRELMGKFLPF